MDRIWAPWRIGYIIKNEKKEKCFLCEAYAQWKKEENFVVYVSNLSFVILNKFPYNNGHLMVVPIRHVAQLEDLNEDELLDLMRVTQKMVVLLKETIKPEGFNVGVNLGKIAGAGLEGHFHLHIVPRWLGDTNFMPVCSDTKVISQSLKELYTQLKRWSPEKK